MLIATGFALWTAVIYASQQLPIGPLSLDLNYWGQILLWVAGMSLALGALYRMYGRPIVGWFQHQGRVHESMADDVSHIRTEQRTLSKRVDILERVVFPTLGGGSETPPPEEFLMTDEQIASRLRFASRIPPPDNAPPNPFRPRGDA